MKAETLQKDVQIVDGFLLHSHEQYHIKVKELLALEGIRLQDLDGDLSSASMMIQDNADSVLVAEEGLMTKNECSLIVTLAQRFPKLKFVLVSVSADARLLHKLINRFKISALMGHLATSGEIALSIKAAGFGSMLLSSDLSKLLTLTPVSEDDRLSPIADSQNSIDAPYRNSSGHLEDADLPSLSKREKEILHLVARGLQSKQIGPILGISVRTVEVHRSNIRKKIGGRGLNAMIAFSNHLKNQELHVNPAERTHILT